MIDDCTGLILAGGDSRRMGRDKTALEFDGQTLLVWCGEVPSASQQQRLMEWREHGYPVYSLGPNAS